MIENFLNLSMKIKVIIVLVPILIIATVIGIMISTKEESVILTSATSKTLGLQEEIITEIKEEVIVVSKDTTIDESLKEKEEETVKFGD